jgi:hypothetical protein
VGIELASRDFIMDSTFSFHKQDIISLVPVHKVMFFLGNTAGETPAVLGNCINIGKYKESSVQGYPKPNKENYLYKFKKL